MRSQRLVDTRLMPSDCESMCIAFSMSTNEIEVVFGTLFTSTYILSIASRMGRSLIGAVPFSSPLISASTMNMFVWPP